MSGVSASEDPGTLAGSRHLLRAPGKLNLRLKFEGRREDGHHLLSMFNIFISLCDEVAVSLHGDAVVRLDGLEGELADPQKTLAARAASAFFEKFRVPLGATISLRKNIPSGAGLGGGSSDAGAVLRLLSDLCQPYLKKHFGDGYQKDLTSLAAGIGADVPFFLRGKFARVSGIGEKIERYDGRFTSGQKVILLTPTVQCPTPEIYASVRARLPILPAHRDLKGEQFGETLRLNTATDGYEPFPSRTIRASLWRQLIAIVHNDFELDIVQKHPALGDFLRQLREVPDTVASFSGSGSALFVMARALDGLEAIKGPVLDRATAAGIAAHEVSLVEQAEIYT